MLVLSLPVYKATAVIKMFCISGSYKWIEKNELSQCEVDIKFKTNRFDTAITGYVRTNNASLSTNLKLDYQFDNFTSEYVRLQLLFNDRSTKQYSKLSGSLQLESSAYRQINTLVNLNFQVSLSFIRKRFYQYIFFIYQKLVQLIS